MMHRKDRVTQDQIIKGLKAKKFAWIDKEMRKVLPKEVYVGMHFRDANSIGKVKELGYHIEEDGDVVTIMKGADVVARTSLVLELKSLAELDMLASVVKVVPPQHKDS